MSFKNWFTKFCSKNRDPNCSENFEMLILEHFEIVILEDFQNCNKNHFYRVKYHFKRYDS